MKIIVCILIISVCWSCKNNTDTEKYQSKRDRILMVKEKIKEINFDAVFIGQFSRLYTLNEYLLIPDTRSPDKLIHVFNKNDYKHITSIIDQGQGPNEIANLGFIGTDETRRTFSATDHGKQEIFSYNMDSILANPLYAPEIKMSMKMKQFPDKYHYLNDTLLIGVIIEPNANSGYNHLIAKINTNTGEISPMQKYTHPKIERKRICFAASVEYGLYVECYNYHDLITVSDLDGNFQYNVYGSGWNDKTTNKFGYYENVVFCKDKIIASYGKGKDRYS
ncbi:MAG: 6-bladed beta-propeller, partial [Prevotellaceae bacterium]|nr:6-bladed beta-propeller [Prevotellaceae bacterium]